MKVFSRLDGVGNGFDPGFCTRVVSLTACCEHFGCEQIAFIDLPVCGVIAHVAVPAAAATSTRTNDQKIMKIGFNLFDF